MVYRRKFLLHLCAFFCCCFAVTFTPAYSIASASTVPVIDPEGIVKVIAEDNAGKVVVVSVFASWCPPCREEMPMLIKFYNNYDKDKLAIIGISADENMAELTAFIDEAKINFPVYSGTVELLQLMRVSSIPHTFIFNKKGELVKSVVGLIPELQFRLILTNLLSE